MRIKEIAAIARVSVPTVRFYEKRGLIPKPPRTAAGYRNYDSAMADQLRFIKHAQRLGFKLEEIRDLMAIRVRPESACGEMRAQALEKIANVKMRIRELEAMKHVLDRLVRSCERGRHTTECPILEAMHGGYGA